MPKNATSVRFTAYKKLKLCLSRVIIKIFDQTNSSSQLSILRSPLQEIIGRTSALDSDHKLLDNYERNWVWS